MNWSNHWMLRNNEVHDRGTQQSKYGNKNIKTQIKLSCHQVIINLNIISYF